MIHERILLSAISPIVSNIDDESYSSEEIEKPDIFTFNSGTFMLPKEDKRNADGSGGEDAFLVSDDQKMLVVADGVGDWGP